MNWNRITIGRSPARRRFGLRFGGSRGFRFRTGARSFLTPTPPPPPPAPWMRALGFRPRGFAGFGEVTQTTLRAAFDDSIAKARAAFADATTNAAHYKAIQPFLDIAARNLAWVRDGTVKVTDAERAELERLEGTLRTLRNAAKVRYANAPNDAPPDRVEAVAAVVASIEWVARIMGTTLASSDAKAALVKNIAHHLTPTGILEDAGAAVKTAVDQVAGALHVPTWAIPVGLGAVGLVLLVNLAGGLRALKGAT